MLDITIYHYTVLRIVTDCHRLSVWVRMSQDKSSAWRTQSSSIARTIKDPAFKEDMSQSERSRLIAGQNDPQFHTFWIAKNSEALYSCYLSLSLSLGIISDSSSFTTGHPDFAIKFKDFYISSRTYWHQQTQSASLALSPSLQTPSLSMSVPQETLSFFEPLADKSGHNSRQTLQSWESCLVQ